MIITCLIKLHSVFYLFVPPCQTIPTISKSIISFQNNLLISTPKKIFTFFKIITKNH